MYHCPGCGHLLTEIKRDIQKLQEKADEEWADRDYEGDPPEVDESEHWACTNKACFYRNTPEEITVGVGVYFNIHHPFKGYRSRRGDSWSISWIN